MLRIKKTDDLRAQIATLKHSQGKISFVPTMGFLHEGHLSLVRLAKKHAAVVVVSIFVNPLQFNNPEDLKKYPRDLERDIAMLEREGVDVVFAPDVASLYPQTHQTRVSVAELSKLHEGEFRAGHFEGVTTVVSMLFNLVQPDFAIFGEKDFQQLRLVEQMVDDLKFPIQIVRGPLVREGDGLAMSSRNARLSPEERTHALHISRGLFAAQAQFRSGTRDVAVLKEAVMSSMTRVPGLTIEYARIVGEESLNELSSQDLSLPAVQARILVAAYVGEVRLIDTIRLEM